MAFLRTVRTGFFRTIERDFLTTVNTTLGGLEEIAFWTTIQIRFFIID